MKTKRMVANLWRMVTFVGKTTFAVIDGKNLSLTCLCWEMLEEARKRYLLFCMYILVEQGVSLFFMRYKILNKFQEWIKSPIMQ